MQIVYFDRYMDRLAIERVFPPEIRRDSSAFFGAFNENDELCGIAALGYEQDTLLLKYLFVPEPYRSKGVATALLDEISLRLEGNTDNYFEAYFDEKDDIDGLRALFHKRLDFIVQEKANFAAAYWLGLSSATLSAL